MITNPTGAVFTESIANMPGEIPVGDFGGVIGAVSQGAAYVRGAGGQIAGMKNKRKEDVRMGPAIAISIVLAVFWVVQYILTYKGIDNWFTKILNYLTFAQGGMSGGVMSAVGGLLGKGMMAMGFSTALGGGFPNIITGVKRLFSPASYKGATVGPIIAGVGVGLILYQIFTGTGDLIGSATAISGILVSLRAFGGGGGLIRMVLGFILRKKRKNPSFMQKPAFSALFIGLTYGFTLAVPLAAIPYNLTHLVVGLTALVVGGIIVLATRDMGGRPQQPQQQPWPQQP